MGENLTLVIRGRLLRTGEVHDEFWIRSNELPGLPEVVERVRALPHRPDIFTSVQKLPGLTPRYPYYYEWDNLAIASFGSYAEWFKERVDSKVRQDIRKSAKEGVRTEIVPFSDELVSGICAIYNEVPVRQGKRFQHFGESFEAVKAENETYRSRSVFIGAFIGSELIGFAKIVLDEDVAMMMQFLSKSAHFNKRPSSALIAKSVELCEQMGLKMLTYGRYSYGKKEKSGLVDFKKNLGFRKVEIPRYYVPLTLKGRLALRLGLHRGIGDLAPAWATAAMVQVREKMHGLPSRPR
jgi:hypothetical protein